MNFNILIFITVVMVSFIGCGVLPKSGSDGKNGSPGQSVVGPAGAPGLDSEPTVAIQLCPNIVPSYPNSFPEYAFCIQGKLYAVYWDGTNAWMAMITPGLYTTSTTGTNCTFTVADNCVVTH